jgi:hypothetical protein
MARCSIDTTGLAGIQAAAGSCDLDAAWVIDTVVPRKFHGNFLPLLNSGRVQLLDNQRLINQLVGLERRTARSGRGTIDHGPGAHDDVINVAAGVLCLVAARPLTMFVSTVRGFGGGNVSPVRQAGSREGYGTYQRSIYH